MNFKAQVERDLTAVFHNAREHADVMEFWIDGVRYKGPVIIDDGGAQFLLTLLYMSRYPC